MIILCGDIALYEQITHLLSVIVTDDSIDNEDEEWYNETVKEAYNKAVENEPAITKDLQEIASNTGTELVGLKHRIKTKESYLRKINTKTKGSSNIQTIEDAIDDTKDVIRYTFQAESKQLVDKYFEINRKLVDKGYRPLRIKNYWLDKRNPYNGVNCNYKDNRGIKFESQYHTEDSFNLKNGLLHELYEKQRVLEVGSKEYVELKKEMAKLSSKLEVPKNIKKVRSE